MSTSRHIILGDIHGCYQELCDLLALVGVTDADIVVSVGDLVDRGPDSPAVLRYFQERCARGRAVVLMGNHERKHVKQVFSYSQEITRLQFGADYAAAVDWMSRLPYHYETPECIVVHAGLMPGAGLAEQREEILCGSISGERELKNALGDRYWHEVYTGPKPVAFGHHVVGAQPLVERGLIYGLDTGACHGGRLTALCLPGFTIHSVPARADHWESEKRKWQEPVLLAKPWLDMGFAKARREIERYADEGGPTIVALKVWLDSFSDLMGRCHAGLMQEAARLEAQHGAAGFSPSAESHPFKGLLQLARRGRLDLDAVQGRCATPRKTLELASSLAIVPPVAVPFPLS